MDHLCNNTNIRNCQQFTCRGVCSVPDESNDEYTEHITDLFGKIICKTYLTQFGSSNEKPLHNHLLSFLQPEAQEKNKATATCFSQMLSIFNYQFLQSKLF